MAKNEVGVTEAPFKLSLQQLPPTFVKKLDKAVEVCQGEQLVLQCIVDGSPLPAVQWYKDGEELHPTEQ